MKKVIYISVIIISCILISLFLIVSYFNKIENRAKSFDLEIKTLWKEYYNLSNVRSDVVKEFILISDCQNKIEKINKIDSIKREKILSNFEMKKSFTKLEVEIDSIIIDLYTCKKENKYKLDNKLKTINARITDCVKNYNEKSLQFNSLYFSFPNNLFLNDLNAKKTIRLDYSNSVEDELTKYRKTQHWIETGNIE